MSKNKFGVTEVDIDLSPDLTFGVNPFFLSITNGKNKNCRRCEECASFDGKYENCYLLDVKRISKKDISQAEFCVFIRDYLRDGYCVMFEYSMFKKKYKIMVFSMSASLIRNLNLDNGRDGMGYDIKFDIIGFYDDSVYKTQNVDEGDLFRRYRVADSEKTILIKAQ